MKTLNALWVATLVLAPATVYSKTGDTPATPVIVTEAKVKDFADEIEALGTLKAKESVELSSAVTEIITKVSFEDNQRVKKGDILLEMDTAEEMAELVEQDSIIAEAKRQVDRLTPLVGRGAASASALDENRRDLDSAKARAAAIQSRINQRILKAPFDGVLGLRNISVGALAQPGALVTTIDDDSVMKLDFSVPEIFLSTLKSGVVIEAETEAYPGKTFVGRIAHVDSRVDPITRSIQARALIPNDEGLLKPGLLMQVELQKDPRKALLIPEEALIANGPNNFVFVVTESDGKTSAERRQVGIGTRQYGEAEIVSGLSAGELIVTHGTLRVRPGAPLSITGVERNGETLKQLLTANSAAADATTGSN